MNAVDLVLLLASILLALVSREAMKRVVARRLGKASFALLEIDYWKASSGRAFCRCLVFLELLSWAAIAFLVASIATVIIQ